MKIIVNLKNGGKIECPKWVDFMLIMNAIRSEVTYKQILVKKEDVDYVIKEGKSKGFPGYNFYTEDETGLYLVDIIQGKTELINAKLTDPVLFSLEEGKEVGPAIELPEKAQYVKDESGNPVVLTTPKKAGKKRGK